MGRNAKGEPLIRALLPFADHDDLQQISAQYVVDVLKVQRLRDPDAIRRALAYRVTVNGLQHSGRSQALQRMLRRFELAVAEGRYIVEGFEEPISAQSQPTALEPELVARELVQFDVETSSAVLGRTRLVGLRVFTGDQSEELSGTAPRTSASTEAAAKEFRSGFPGRPTIKHLIVAELERRAEGAEIKSRLAEEARELREWAASTHPTAPVPSARSIENQIRERHRALVASGPRTTHEIK